MICQYLSNNLCMVLLINLTLWVNNKCSTTSTTCPTEVAVTTDLVEVREEETKTREVVWEEVDICSLLLICLTNNSSSQDLLVNPRWASINILPRICLDPLMLNNSQLWVCKPDPRCLQHSLSKLTCLITIKLLLRLLQTSLKRSSSLVIAYIHKLKTQWQDNMQEKLQECSLTRQQSRLIDFLWTLLI